MNYQLDEIDNKILGYLVCKYENALFTEIAKLMDVSCRDYSRKS